MSTSRHARKKSRSSGQFDKAKRLLTSLFLAANVVSVALLLLCGHSMRISPEVFSPLVAFGLTFPIYIVVCIAFIPFWLLFKVRYCLVSIVALALCASPIRTYCPLNVPNPHPKGCIKVMSYNVKGFSENETKKNNHMEELLTYLRQSDADIVCFQEFNFFPDQNGAKIRQTLERWPYRDSIKTGTHNNLGICSRFPILKREPIVVGMKEHGSVAYRLRIGKDTVIVINNHFVSNAISPNDKSKYQQLVKEPSEARARVNARYLINKIGQAGAQRALQAKAIVRFLESEGDKPVILCGDFNDSPIAYPHFLLTRKLNDAYTRSGNGVGVSFRDKGMYFRLDNVLCSDKWDIYSAEVDSRIAASDHYPISGWFRLKKH